MLNANEVKKKSSTEEQQTTPQPPQTLISEKESVKEELKKFSDKRSGNSIIGEDHSRATHLLSNSSLEKLNHLVNFIEASYGLNSELTKGMDEKEVKKARTLTKGTRSKALNFALQHFLDTWEQEEGLIPNTEHKKYKISNVYHNAYRFTQDGVTYGILQNNRGKEISFMSTDSGNTVEEINEWFDSIEDQSKREGRPSKK